jgi:hypothetical protein
MVMTTKHTRIHDEYVEEVYGPGEPPPNDTGTASTGSGQAGTASAGNGQAGPADATLDEALFDPWAEFHAPKFPLDVLPPVVRNFVAMQSAVIGADVSAMAMATLGALSGAIDHRFALKMMRFGNWWAHPRLWVLLVGAPSTMKTPVMNAATKPLEWYQKERMQEHKAAVAAHIAAGGKAKDADAPPPPVRYVTWDSTVEKLGEILSRAPRGILVKRDEVTGWIGSMERYRRGHGTSPDRAFWLQAYNGGTHVVDRISRGEINVENLSVSLLGGIQPDRLTEIQSFAADGLLQRLLPVMLNPGKPPQDVPADDAAYKTLVHNLINLDPVLLHMTDDALERMKALGDYLHDYGEACVDLASGFQAFVIKLTAVAGGLALILHLATDSIQTEPIPDGIVAAAERIIRDFILLHGLEFYRLGVNAHDNLRRIASFILTSGKSRVVASDLTSNMWDMRGLSLKEVNDCMSPLVAGGWLEPETKVSFSNKAWTVLPAVATRFAAQRKIEEERKARIAEAIDKSAAKKRRSTKEPPQ